MLSSIIFRFDMQNRRHKNGSSQQFRLEIQINRVKFRLKSFKLIQPSQKDLLLCHIEFQSGARKNAWQPDLFLHR